MSGVVAFSGVIAHVNRETEDGRIIRSLAPLPEKPEVPVFAGELGEKVGIITRFHLRYDILWAAGTLIPAHVPVTCLTEDHFSRSGGTIFCGAEIGFDLEVGRATFTGELVEFHDAEISYLMLGARPAWKTAFITFSIKEIS